MTETTLVTVHDRSAGCTLTLVMPAILDTPFSVPEGAYGAGMTSTREVLIGTTRVHRESLQLRGAAVTGLLAVALTAASIAAGQGSSAMGLVLGSTFVGIMALSGAPDVRLRGMLWTTLWLVGATLLGGLVSPWLWPELIVVALVGLIGGYAGALGPRGTVIGILAMVVYTIFAGSDLTASETLKAAVLVAIGAGIHVLVTITPTLITHPRRLMQRTEHPPSAWARLDFRTRTDDLFWHHGVRLAIALVIGSALGHHIGWPHPYWIPMTIVWMSKPDTAGTVSRIVERIAGTLLGLGVAIVLIDGISDGTVAISLYTGIGVFIGLAFLTANYPIAVTGITLMVITLFSLQGEPVGETAPYRIAATLVAGVITAVIALTLWRSPRTGS